MNSWVTSYFRQTVGTVGYFTQTVGAVRYFTQTVGILYMSSWGNKLL